MRGAYQRRWWRFVSRRVCIGTWAVRLGGGLRRAVAKACARALTAEVAVWMGLRLPDPQPPSGWAGPG